MLEFDFRKSGLKTEKISNRAAAEDFSKSFDFAGILLTSGLEFGIKYIAG